jgi:hypothetical protein
MLTSRTKKHKKDLQKIKFFIDDREEIIKTTAGRNESLRLFVRERLPMKRRAPGRSWCASWLLTLRGILAGELV